MLHLDVFLLFTPRLMISSSILSSSRVHGTRDRFQYQRDDSGSLQPLGWFSCQLALTPRTPTWFSLQAMDLSLYVGAMATVSLADTYYR